MSASPLRIGDIDDRPISRKPPITAQYNWITGGVDVIPEQLELPLPPADDVVLPDDGSIISARDRERFAVVRLGVRAVHRKKE